MAIPTFEVVMSPILDVARNSAAHSIGEHEDCIAIVARLGVPGR